MIKNNFGKPVTIITSGHPNSKYKLFIIPADQEYKIKTTHSTSSTMFITAFDGATPIQINGQNSVQVTSSLKPESHMYYVPSSKLQTTYYSDLIYLAKIYCIVLKEILNFKRKLFYCYLITFFFRNILT